MSTGQSVWEEPPELILARLPAAPTASAAKPKAPLNSDIVSSWREMTHASGRKYYHNTVTKMTMWEIPPEYAEYLERTRDPVSLDRQTAEARFMAMLRELGIGSRHSWEETLRDIIIHQNYMLVPTLAERKALFAKPVDAQRDVEKEERHQRAAHDREAFKTMLRVKGVTTTTRYGDVADRISSEPEFKAITNARERADLFEGLIDELRREESEANRARKRRAAEKLEDVLCKMSEIRVDTPWRIAQDLIHQQPSLRTDPDLSGMEPMDILIGYETYIKKLERAEQQREVEQRDGQHRQERLNRKAFVALLDEMQRKGSLRATTSWVEFYQMAKEKPELVRMLVQGGSTPLDLFWDRIHELQEAYVKEARMVFAMLAERLAGGWAEKVRETDVREAADKLGLAKETLDTIRQHLFPSTRASSSPADNLPAIIVKVDALRVSDRKLVDRLKHAIKHFCPPIALQSTWEEYRPLLAANAEVAEVPDEDIRWYYFNKYLRHLRKKAGLEGGDSGEEDDAKR